jgi:predicted kinase
MTGTDDGRPLVVAFSGLPGTGKSTAAEALARAHRVPAFATDWLLGSLVPHGVLRGLPYEQLLALDRGLLETLVRRQLMLGQSAITDGLMDDDEARARAEWIGKEGGRLVVVECVCSDAALHRSRIEGRQRRIPGWHEVDWTHVERMRDRFRPLTVERLILDAVHPLEDNLRRLTEHCGW